MLLAQTINTVSSLEGGIITLPVLLFCSSLFCYYLSLLSGFRGVIGLESEPLPRPASRLVCIPHGEITIIIWRNVLSNQCNYSSYADGDWVIKTWRWWDEYKLQTAQQDEYSASVVTEFLWSYTLPSLPWKTCAIHTFLQHWFTSDIDGSFRICKSR